jgi:hypothetical protein
MIDDTTQTKIQTAYDHSFKAGTNVWDELDRRGLVLTQDKRKEVEAAALTQLLIQMEGYSASALAGQDQTVQGAVDGCLNYIRMYRDLVAK